VTGWVTSHTNSTHSFTNPCLTAGHTGHSDAEDSSHRVRTARRRPRPALSASTRQKVKAMAAVQAAGPPQWRRTMWRRETARKCATVPKRNRSRQRQLD
jgi:hypothetical protein